MGCRNKGFTLVELMVSIAIVGILTAMAVPAYHTWQQRAYGSEAAIMLKQLTEAEITYYLDNNKYFSEDTPLSVRHDSQEPANASDQIFNNLHLRIPQGHFIDYDLYAEEDTFYLIITVSDKANFDLFKGTSQIYAILDKDGQVNIMYAGLPK